MNLSVFPEPRLQVNDAGEMSEFMESEQKLLNAPQPFTEASGTVHLPIALAMKLIVERGLPVRPNSPPAVRSTQTAPATEPIACEDASCTVWGRRKSGMPNQAGEGAHNGWSSKSRSVELQARRTRGRYRRSPSSRRASKRSLPQLG